MRSSFIGAAAAALLFVLSWPGGPARACSVCLAGDAVYDAQGAGAQQPGDLTAYFEIRGFQKKSGHLPEGGDHGHEEGGHGHEPGPAVEENQNIRLRMLLAWTPFDRITLSLDVPAVFTEIVETEGHHSTRMRSAGLGDVTSNLALVLWRNRDVLPSTSLEARLFLKAPTGQSRLTEQGVRDKHLQPGTGSWDFGGGLAATWRLAWGSLYASALYRENTEGSLEYEYGDVWLGNLAASAPLGHWTGVPELDRIAPGLELNFRHAERDRFRGGRFADSGGAMLYVTPTLRFQLPWRRGGVAPSIRAGVQIPLTDAWLHGFQREGEVWTAGVVLPF